MGGYSPVVVWEKQRPIPWVAPQDPASDLSPVCSVLRAQAPTPTSAVCVVGISLKEESVNLPPPWHPPDSVTAAQAAGDFRLPVWVCLGMSSKAGAALLCPFWPPPAHAHSHPQPPPPHPWGVSGLGWALHRCQVRAEPEQCCGERAHPSALLGNCSFITF